MSTSTETGNGSGDGDVERVIDRSGDIDQRPPEERGLPVAANAVALWQADSPIAESRHQVQRFVPPDPRPTRSQPAPPELADIAQRLQKDLDKQYAKAKSQLEALSQKIEAQEKRCSPPKLDGDLQQIRFQRQKIPIANGPELAGRLREEKSRLADLEAFKVWNRLSRDAHYPSSPVLAFGILAILVLVEAGINGVLFADGSDQGLFGGWLEALVLSITNVGAAFLFGRMILPLLHRRGSALRAGATILCLAGLAALVAINLIGAHYRDFKAASGVSPDPPAVTALKHETSVTLGGMKPGGTNPRKAAKPAQADASPPQQAPVAAKQKITEGQAIARLTAAPFAFGSFMSFFLFVIGLCGAAIAALDGYKLDDPFPGYGKRHRAYVAAREQSAQTLRRILSQSNAIMTGSFQAIGRKIEDFGQEMSTLLALHHAYAGDRELLQDNLEEAFRNAGEQLAYQDRLLNKTPGRDPFSIFTLSTGQLPRLGEAQVKFYEAQDKKLKALGKSAQKEQGDLLGVFEAASADFQKLLTEASQASLQAALAGEKDDRAGSGAA